MHDRQPYVNLKTTPPSIPYVNMLIFSFKLIDCAFLCTVTREIHSVNSRELPLGSREANSSASELPSPLRATRHLFLFREIALSVRKGQGEPKGSVQPILYLWLKTIRRCSPSPWIQRPGLGRPPHRLPGRAGVLLGEHGVGGLSGRGSCFWKGPSTAVAPRRLLVGGLTPRRARLLRWKGLGKTRERTGASQCAPRFPNSYPQIKRCRAMCSLGNWNSSRSMIASNKRCNLFCFLFRGK